MDLRTKAFNAMRRYRQHAASSDTHARAIKRLVRTATWRAIVRDREQRDAYARGVALERMGY